MTFKIIKPYSNYKIFSNGEIFSLYTNKFLSQSINNKGYKYVDLINDHGIRKKELVHRLVATAFLDNTENFPIVLHLDDNPLNCDVSNLKFGTYSENNKMAVLHGHMKVPKPDNHKKYTLYKPKCPFEIEFNGVKPILKFLNLEKDSTIRNYIFRNSKIPNGRFKGWKIKPSE